MQSQIEEAKKIINNADAVLITAGAGMGVDSGLPDFRGDKGLWNAYPPLQKAGYSFTEVESGYLFRKNPQLAWGFYGHRIKLYTQTKPHHGFTLLRHLVQQKRNNYFIFTSNVDTHFQAAGFDRDKIYEVHGSIEYLQCIDNCNETLIKNKFHINVDMQTLHTQDIPYCTRCKQVMVPNILFFGGTSFNESRVASQNKRFLSWLQSVKNQQVVIIEIGAGTTVPTIRNFNDSYTKRYKNFTLIRINPAESTVSSNNIGIAMGALEALIQIL